MDWLFLGLAIVFEVAGTTSMKLSDGFSKPLFSVIMAIAYIICFSFLTEAIKTIEIGTAYAIWSGVGTALIVLVGLVFFRDAMTIVKMASLLLIIIGVVGLQLSGLKV